MQSANSQLLAKFIKTTVFRGFALRIFEVACSHRFNGSAHTLTFGPSKLVDWSIKYEEESHVTFEKMKC